MHEPHALTFLIRRDELNSAAGKRALNGRQGACSGVHGAAFKTQQRVDRNDGPIGKLLLRPAEQSASGPNLTSRNHHRQPVRAEG